MFRSESIRETTQRYLTPIMMLFAGAGRRSARRHHAHGYAFATHEMNRADVIARGGLSVSRDFLKPR
jgi:hypothetical protein